jgi:hypothetical protein
MVAKRTKVIVKDVLIAVLLGFVIIALLAHRVFHAR